MVSNHIHRTQVREISIFTRWGSGFSGPGAINNWCVEQRGKPIAGQVAIIETPTRPALMSWLSMSKPNSVTLFAITLFKESLN